MKTSVKVLIGVGAVILIALMLFGWGNSTYNSAVRLQEEVNASWSDVQSSYQRRADLIPNLLETVKGAAANEQTILTKVTQARAGIVGVNDEILNAKNPQQMELVGRKINTAINLAYEAYPQIRSTENFQQFQSQLEGTENRINFARDQFNGKVKDYNSFVRGVVKRFWLGIFGEEGEFAKKEGFQAAAGSENAPKVKF